MMRTCRATAIVALAAASAALAASCTTVDPATERASGPTSAHTPVIFVPGYLEDASMWASADTAFKAAGYQTGDITKLVFDTTTVGAVEAARALSVEVEALEWKTGKVDLVAHSLGNLVIKECIGEGGCAGKVAHWENISGAQNSTSVATACDGPSCIDMRPGSALVTRLQAGDDAAIAAQGVKVQVHWIAEDDIIQPPQNSTEPYAENILVPNPDKSLTHLNIFNDPGVLGDTVTFFNG
jgi:triacylglycerol lipase